MNSTTSTVTAFPRHLYRWVSLTPSVHPSGNPCRRSHSVGVNLRRLLSVMMPCLSCAVTVKEGYPLSLNLRPAWRLVSLSGVNTGIHIIEDVPHSYRGIASTTKLLCPAPVFARSGGTISLRSWFFRLNPESHISVIELWCPPLCPPAVRVLIGGYSVPSSDRLMLSVIGNICPVPDPLRCPIMNALSLFWGTP